MVNYASKLYTNNIRRYFFKKKYKFQKKHEYHTFLSSIILGSMKY